MFIANLNAKVDFYTLINWYNQTGKPPSKENLETLKQQGPVNRMNVSCVEIVNQVTKYLRDFAKHLPHTPPLGHLNPGQLHRNPCI